MSRMRFSARWVVAAVVFLTIFAAGTSAQAALITSPPGGGTVVNFSQFAFCTGFGSTSPAGCRTGTNVGSLVGESIIFTASEVGSFTGFGQLYNAGWGLIGNGEWSSGRVGYAGLNNQLPELPSIFMMFTFATPVSIVGGLMNYATGGTTPIIEVLDSSLSVLESYDLSVAPISTPGGLNLGAFRGISRPIDDIWAFRVRSGFVPVLDDLTFLRGGGVPVPEPASALLLGSGLMALGFLRRRFGWARA